MLEPVGRNLTGLGVKSVFQCWKVGFLFLKKSQFPSHLTRSLDCSEIYKTSHV